MPRSNAQRRREARVRVMPSQPARVTRPALNLHELRQVFTIPGFAILPLRAFLGITLLYAGWQKLTDPGFFRVGSPSYIGTQLLQFSKGSPIHFLMVHFLEHAVAIGALTIATEMVIGLLILVGLFTRLAAFGGFVLNLIFFLSASWHVYPYFLGNDIVFVMCWLTLMLTGPGAFALDPVVSDWVAEAVTRPVERVLIGPLNAIPEETPEEERSAPVSRPALRVSRREAIFGGLATLVLLALGLAPRGRIGPAAASAPVSATKPSAPSSASSPSGQPTTPAGQKVGNVSQIPVNSALATTDPKSGDPAVIVHTSSSDFFAYDAICTHAGCSVQYDPSYRLLVCPCHGGAYDPAHGAQVVAGPPPAPLTALPVTIDKQGNIYLS